MPVLEFMHNAFIQPTFMKHLLCTKHWTGLGADGEAAAPRMQSYKLDQKQGLGRGPYPGCSQRRLPERGGSRTALKPGPSQNPGAPGHASSSARGARALTVWCKHRVSEAPDFFPRRGPTRCKQMAVAFLNMPPRAEGRRPLQGQRRENTLAGKMALGPGLGPPAQL